MRRVAIVAIVAALVSVGTVMIPIEIDRQRFNAEMDRQYHAMRRDQCLQLLPSIVWMLSSQSRDLQETGRLAVKHVCWISP